MPKVVTSGGRAIRRQLGREGRALMNGTTALEKEAPERSLSLSTLWRYMQRTLGCLGKPRGSDLSAKGWSGQGLEPKGEAFLRPPGCATGTRWGVNSHHSHLTCY